MLAGDVRRQRAECLHRFIAKVAIENASLRLDEVLRLDFRLPPVYHFKLRLLQVGLLTVRCEDVLHENDGVAEGAAARHAGFTAPRLLVEPLAVVCPFVRLQELLRSEALFAVWARDARNSRDLTLSPWELVRVRLVDV